MHRSKQHHHSITSATSRNTRPPLDTRQQSVYRVFKRPFSYWDLDKVGSVALTSSVKCLKKNSFNLFRLSIVAS
jgi:hypothetical protein